MTTEKEELSIHSLPQATEDEFIALVKSFTVFENSPEINGCQRDGATAVIDLAVEFEKFAQRASQEISPAFLVG